MAHINKTLSGNSNPDYLVGNQRIASRVESQQNQISLRQLQNLLLVQEINFQVIKQKIVEVILLTLHCVHKELQQIPNSFELFEYKFIIDQELKPWLINVHSKIKYDISCFNENIIKS